MPPVGARTPPLAPRRACLKSTRPSLCPLAGIGRGGCWPSRAPGYLVSVGYMDPGNWATDLAGGAQFGYTLLFGHPAVEPDGDPAAGARRRGSASSPDATWPRPAATTIRGRSAIVLWMLCELAIIACDLAEVIGTAIALQAAVRHSRWSWGALITALDAFLRAVPDEQGLSLSRSLRHRAADRHRRLLRAFRSSPPRRRSPAVLGGLRAVAPRS